MLARRQFMKALAMAPAGMVEPNSKQFIELEGTTRKKCDRDGLITETKMDKFCAATKAMWGMNSIGRKVKFTIHKDGLDVRFV